MTIFHFLQVGDTLRIVFRNSLSFGVNLFLGGEFLLF